MIHSLIYDTSGYRARLRVWAKTVVVILWITAILAVIAAIAYGICMAARGSASATCRHLATQTGLQTSFKIPHFMSGGTCFITLPNGQVAPFDKVQFRVNGG